jgi:hypothetical protein
MTSAIRNRVASALSALLGVMTVGTGIYFAFLRPPMLPEDVRRTGVARGALPPAFADWLSIVFRTWGGFMVGLGVLLIAVSLYLRRGDSRWIRGGAAVGALVAFGSFLASNIQLRSDFLWFIAILFGLAAALAVAVWPTPAPR